MPKIKIMLECDRTIDSPEDIGIAHLPGCFRLGYETLCGRVDTGAKWEYREKGTVTCPDCLAQVRHVLGLLTPTERKKYEK